MFCAPLLGTPGSHRPPCPAPIRPCPHPRVARPQIGDLPCRHPLPPLRGLQAPPAGPLRPAKRSGCGGLIPPPGAGPVTATPARIPVPPPRSAPPKMPPGGPTPAPPAFRKGHRPPSHRRARDGPLSAPSAVQYRRPRPSPPPWRRRSGRRPVTPPPAAPQGPPRRRTPRRPPPQGSPVAPHRRARSGPLSAAHEWLRGCRALRRQS